MGIWITIVRCPTSTIIRPINSQPPRKDIKDLTKYWLEKFDWRAVEKKLNELPHFITPITVEGFNPLDIHFIHQKSDVKDAIPLLFVHGWPGSFIEVTKLLPLLKGGDGKQAFHVVAPSLPNYGFSGRVAKVGCTPRLLAVADDR